MLLVHALLCAIIDDGHTLREHHPSKCVRDSGLLALARVPDSRRVVVVVNEVAKDVQAVVLSTRELFLHGGAEPGEVEVRKGVALAVVKVPGPAEASGRHGRKREIQQAIEDLLAARASARARLELVRGMERLVGGRDLPHDFNAYGLLELSQEPAGNEGRSVQTDRIDVVGIYHVDGPFQEVLADEWHTLVEISKVVEPSFVGDVVVVTLTRVVAYPAVGQVSRGRVVWGERLAPQGLHRCEAVHGLVLRLHVPPAPCVVVECVRGLQLVEVGRIVEGTDFGHVGTRDDGAHVVDHHVVHEAHAPLVQGI
mmetsp:Transcript_22752/g.60059  ORF Transcript_22752/g.60059 Transcript_22752/m.60059 type:complete len:311 (+) Transcript_22752:1095-2027(+)